MESKKIHHLWVVNESRQPIGLVAQTDLMRAIVRTTPDAYGLIGV